MNLYEERYVRDLKQKIALQNLEITELKFERDRRQKQITHFMDITIELLEGLGWKKQWILGYYQARRRK